MLQIKTNVLLCRFDNVGRFSLINNKRRLNSNVWKIYGINYDAGKLLLTSV